MSGYAAQDVYVPSLDAPNGVETEADVVALLTEAGWDAYVVSEGKMDVITSVNPECPDCVELGCQECPPGGNGKRCPVLEHTTFVDAELLAAEFHSHSSWDTPVFGDRKP